MNPSLTRLLQLASPTLPVGAYSYSQGLEAAIEAGIVCDAATTQAWIGDVLSLTMARLEAPVLLRLIDAWQGNVIPAVQRWNEYFLASRESAELRAESLQMGYSLARLLREMNEGGAALDVLGEEIAFPAAFALAVVRWRIDAQAALTAYIWSWTENQVMAALKAVPLGQTDGQRLLLALGDTMAAVAGRAAELADDDLCNFAPGLALLSAQHETQYSRLFRS